MPPFFPNSCTSFVFLVVLPKENFACVVTCPGVITLYLKKNLKTNEHTRYSADSNGMNQHLILKTNTGEKTILVNYERLSKGLNT